jgi:Fe2+ or Zn2+ uptake regulation protein
MCVGEHRVTSPHLLSRIQLRRYRNNQTVHAFPISDHAATVARDRARAVRYEHDFRRQRHDHLICTACGPVIEFFNESIEAEQERVTRRFGFAMTYHRLKIYGLCEGCQVESRRAAATQKE